MPERDEPLELFASAETRPSAREEFLTGILAQWAADDRERGAKAIPEEKRRAREGAKAALGEIAR